MRRLLHRAVQRSGLPSFARRTFATAGTGAGLFASYNALLESNPIPTKAVTSAVIVGLGDIFCQLGVEKRSLSGGGGGGGAASAPPATSSADGTVATTETAAAAAALPFDFTRLGRMCFLGATLVGPVLHYWYGFLYRTLPATGNKGAFQRMAMDQICFAPPYIAVFVGSLLTLEGSSSNFMPYLTGGAYVDNLLTNYMLWIPAQLFNFRFVPLAYNVMFSNFTALFWNTYLSWSTHKDQDH